MFNEFKKEVVGILGATGIKVCLNDIEEPPDLKMGDLAFPCFMLAKKMKKNPADVAKDIGEKIKIPENSLVERYEVTGPYINFFFNRGIFAKEVIEEVIEREEKYYTPIVLGMYCT